MSQQERIIQHVGYNHKRGTTNDYSLPIRVVKSLTNMEKHCLVNNRTLPYSTRRSEENSWLGAKVLQRLGSFATPHGDDSEKLRFSKPDQSGRV